MLCHIWLCYSLLPFPHTKAFTSYFEESVKLGELLAILALLRDIFSDSQYSTNVAKVIPLPQLRVHCIWP